jgi:hypothetical protein
MKTRPFAPLPLLRGDIDRTVEKVIISIYFLATLSYNVPQHLSSKRKRRDEIRIDTYTITFRPESFRSFD